jgi:hypothetical protein
MAFPTPVGDKGQKLSRTLKEEKMKTREINQFALPQKACYARFPGFLLISVERVCRDTRRFLKLTWLQRILQWCQDNCLCLNSMIS